MTCNCQGFFFKLGAITMYPYNASLCIYYCCVLAFKMKENHVKKYVEPVLHLIPISLGLIAAVGPLLSQMYNPSTLQAWCVAVSYPQICRDDLEPVWDEDKTKSWYAKKCIRGTQNLARAFVRHDFWVMVYALITSYVSLFVVVWVVTSTGRRLMRHKKFLQSHGYDLDESNLQRAISKQRESRAVMIQAFGYIAVLTLTLFGTIIRQTHAKNKISGLNENMMELVFFPQQGFFNFLIFIGHKVYNSRRPNPELSICGVIKKLFCSSTDEPIFLSRITLVEDDVADVEMRVLENDELGNNADYVISGGDDGDGDSSPLPLDWIDDNDDTKQHKQGVINHASSNSNSSAGNDVLLSDGSKSGLSGFDVSEVMSRGGLSGFDASTVQASEGKGVASLMSGTMSRGGLSGLDEEFEDEKV